MPRLKTWLTGSTTRTTTALRVEAFEPRDVPAAPTVSLFSPTPMQTSASPIPVTVTFSENVFQFTDMDLVTTNATVNNFQQVSGSTFTFDLIPAGDGLVSARVPAGAAYNAGSEANLAAPRLLRSFDDSGPTPQIMLGNGQGLTTTGDTATFKVVFNESVTGMDAADIVVGGTAGGSVSGVTGSGNMYEVTVSGVTGLGTVTIQVLGGAAVDSLGNVSVASAVSPAVTRISTVPTAEQQPSDLPSTVATAGPGATGTQVRIYDPATGEVLTSVTPFPGYAGRIGMAQGDVTGDGIADIFVGAGAGGAPHVKLFDGVTGAELRSFFAYDPAFRGGVSVAVGDVTGDGTADFVVAAGPGGGPHVRVFDGVSGDLVHSFFAYDPAFRNGLNVAVGDVNGDGLADIVTGTRQGGAPHVKVFDGMSSSELRSFFAYDIGFLGGVNVAVGDVNGDGMADIYTGTGAGGASHVKVFDGSNGATVRNFFAYDPAFVGGVNVAAADTNRDGIADVVTGTGVGGAPHIKVFDGTTNDMIHSFFAFDSSSTGGASVG